MGCCAQSQSNQSQYAFDFTTLAKPAPVHPIRYHLSKEDGEICGDKFIRVGDYHKSLGNSHLMRGEYTKAITEFTKAIDYNPENSIYFSNRALCFKAKREWENAISDSRQALVIDPNNLKALNVFAVALIEMERNNKFNVVSLQEAVRCLEHANNVFLRQKQIFEEQGKMNEVMLIQKELGVKLRKAKKMLKLRKQMIETPKKNETEDFLNSLLQKETRRDPSAQFYVELYEEIKLDNQIESSDVPDHLMCKISYEIMKDPRLTPDGISYDFVMLDAHFQRIGNTDPITRKEIDMTKVVPNINLRLAIEHFLDHKNIRNPEQFEPEKKETNDIEL